MLNLNIIDKTGLTVNFATALTGKSLSRGKNNEVINEEKVYGHFGK